MKLENSWFLKVMVPVLGLLIAVWSVLFTGDDKGLSYELVSETQFKSQGLESWKDLSIYYEGKEINEGGIVTVKIFNSGNSPIYSNEFDSPIKITVDDKTEFIDAKVTNKFPDALNPELRIDKDVVNILPLLLNPKDELSVQIVTSGKPDTFNVSARIGGISEVTNAVNKRRDNIDALSWIYVIFGVICFSVASLSLDFVIDKPDRRKVRKLPVKAYVLVSFVAFTSAVASLIHFVEVRSWELAWNMIWYIIGLTIVSEIIAFQFKRDRNEDA